MRPGFSLIIIIVVAFNLNGQFLYNSKCDKSLFSFNVQFQDNKGLTKNLYLHKATGNLEVWGPASTSQFEVYFLLPIAYREQAPLWLDIQCPQLIDYRFVRLDAFNTFVAARLNSSPGLINLNWTSWTLIKQHDYSGIPASVPIPTYYELPDSVKPYLMPTGCVQWEDPFVKHIADSVRGTTNDLIVLASRIANYCAHITGSMSKHPISWDAYYTMNWGNTCVGHAHAGAALFRANGVPCRVLMSMVTTTNYDMHWIVEYFVPNYGWVKMETTSGVNPYNNAQQQIITFACNPEDEFSLTLHNNIESYWITSDTNIPAPNWCGVHSSMIYCTTVDTASKVDLMISLTDSVYKYFTTYKGINLTNGQNIYFQTALDFQYKTLNYIKLHKRDSILFYLNQALENYRKIELKSLQTIFVDDFENGINGWTHGGVNDEWELGNPMGVGPTHAYSGDNCWGTDLDSVYENSADCWLLSPLIFINNLSCAYLSFKIWNDVEDDSLYVYHPIDRLWLEISTDNGVSFKTLTTYLGGVIDYKTGVPQVPGWSRLVLDLTPYLNSVIQIRFRFTSNFSISRPGSYIDDVRIYGREMSTQEITKYKIEQIVFKIYPNPANDKITITNNGLPVKETVISIFNINGVNVLSQTFYNQKSINVDVNGFGKGIYLVKIQTSNGVETKKLLIQ